MDPIKQAITSHSLDKPHIHKINLHSIKPYTTDLNEVIKKIVDVYNNIKQKRDDARYDEESLPGSFKLEGYSIVRIFYARPKISPNSFARLLKKVGSATDFSSNTLHFLLFLGSEDKGLYALTHHHSWNVVKSFCDYRFPFIVAKRLTRPIFAFAETKPIVGNKISEADAFKEEFQAQEQQLQNIWRIFKKFSTSFKETSSIFLLEAFAKYVSDKVGVSFGSGQISLGINMTLPAICETIDHFSKVYTGEVTTRIDGEEEKDDPKYGFLDYIQPVKGELHTLLSEQLLDLVWQFYAKRISAVDVFFCHRYTNDFCRSTEFKMEYKGSKKSNWEHVWHYPPTFFEVISKLREKFHISDKEKFLARLNNIRMKYNKKESKFRLNEFFHGEIRGEEGAYFRVEGIWYEVKADYLMVVQRHFYHLLQNYLIKKGEPGYIDKTWFRSEEWASFSLKEAPKASLAHLEELTESKYVIVDEEGVVKHPHALPLLFDNLDRTVEKKRADLDYLLKKSSRITLADLKALGFKKAKALMTKLKQKRPVLASFTKNKVKRWIVKGPVPENSPLKAFLKGKHEEYLQVGKEEFFNRSFLEDRGFLVGDQVYASEKEKVELWDLLNHDDEGCLYLYQVKSEFNHKAREACSQIRVAAQTLRADLASTNPLLRKMYAKATQGKKKTVFEKKLAESYGKFSEAEFIDLFRNKPRYVAGKEKGIVFVYAVLDDGEGAERLFEEEQDVENPLERADFSAWTTEMLDSLKNAGYLNDEMQITSKVLKSTKEDFCSDESIVVAEIDKPALYKVLSKRDTHFNSVIAKLELIHLKSEMEKWGFGFKVMQIRRGQARSSSDALPLVRATLAKPPNQVSLRNYFKRVEAPTIQAPSSKKTKVTTIPGHPGIHNPGNDCFLISAFQLLLHSDFSTILQDQNLLESAGEEWFSEFTQFMTRYDQDSSSLSVTNFREVLRFSDEEQEDASEAIHKIITFYNPSTFSSQVNYVRKMTENYSISQTESLATLEMELSGSTFQSQLDQFFSKKTSNESFTFLDASGTPNKTDSFDETCIPIQLNNTLLVTLKRFDNNGNKIATSVDFGEGFCQIGEKRYELHGFIEHIGGRARSGHYKAYCRTEDSWLCFDNEFVNPISEQDFLEKAKKAYVVSIKAIE